MLKKVKMTNLLSKSKKKKKKNEDDVFSFSEHNKVTLSENHFLVKIFSTGPDPVIWTINRSYNILLAGNTDQNGSGGDTVQKKSGLAHMLKLETQLVQGIYNIALRYL